MKRIIFPLLLALLLMSCSDDIKTNAPAIQGQTDYGYFHSLDARIYSNDDGTFTMVGEHGSKVLSLTLNSLSEGTEYELGGNAANFATYDMGEVLYSTDSLGDGMVKIKYIKEDGVYGSFNFNARVDGHTGDTLNFSQGAFFGVPLVDGTLLPDDEDEIVVEDCETATENLDAAYQAYLNAAENMEEDPEAYAEACGAYVNALLEKALACEEDLEEIQNTIEELDCFQGV